MKCLVPFVLVVLTATAYAEQPWESGVPQAKRDQAQALFAEGNQLFAQQAHAPALDKYRAAIALWDHPLIRFNMAVTQIRLDRILAAAEDLDAALRFGQAPFAEDEYQKALDYQKLLAGRVGHVEASCDQAGAQVQLDGKPWFACPGTNKLRVLAGEHAIVGEKREFMTFSRRVVVTGGATASTKVQLLPLDDVVKLEYPSPRWLPWTTAGVGAAVVLGGVGVYVTGRNQMKQFERDFAVECMNGCRSDLSDVPQLARDRDSAELKGTIGITMLATGSALVGGGIVWIVLNRPRRVLPQLETQPTQGGMTVRASWQF